MQLSFDDPLVAVFLRTLAWEAFVAGRQLKVGDVVRDQVQVARMELGLAPSHKGAPHQFVQDLRKHKPPLLAAAPRGGAQMPADPKWKDEWRLNYAPSHRQVRSLSSDPVVIGTGTPGDWLISVRSPAHPQVRLSLGTGKPTASSFDDRRGLYFLREEDCLYVGKSDEFGVRLGAHAKRDAKWWVFASPEDPEKTFTLDALAAGEALLISLWNETCRLGNGNRGTDRRPALVYLQHAVLIVEAVSAAMVWLMRAPSNNSIGVPTFELPFKTSKGRGWPQCYLRAVDGAQTRV